MSKPGQLQMQQLQRQQAPKRLPKLHLPYLVLGSFKLKISKKVSKLLRVPHEFDLKFKNNFSHLQHANKHNNIR